jgi:hypothetical protein
VTQPPGFAHKVGFVWSVADLLRGDFKAHEYGQVILPLVVLRRLECALAPTKDKVIAKGEELADSPGRDAVLKAVAKHRFWNASPLDLSKILADQAPPRRACAPTSGQRRPRASLPGHRARLSRYPDPRGGVRAATRPRSELRHLSGRRSSTGHRCRMCRTSCSE